MEKCKDEKLIKKAKQFFEDDKERKIIYVTPDGQFFNNTSDCAAYCAFKNFSVSAITKDMLSEKSTKTDKKSTKETADKPKKP